MEFIIVPVLFAIALGLLSLGKILGKDTELHTCKGGGEAESCGSCTCDTKMTQPADENAALKDIARMDDPNREKRYTSRLNVNPERLN